MTHLTEDQIAQYAEALKNGSKDQLPIEIREHVKDCDDCAMDVMAVYDIINLEQTAEKQIELPVKKNNRLLWMSIAATITYIILGSIYINFQNNKDPQVQPIVSNNDTININKDKPIAIEKDSTKISIPKENTTDNSFDNQLAEAYIPNNNLEILVSRFQSGELRGNDIQIITEEEVTFKTNQKIILEWIYNCDLEMNVEIYNNKNEKINAFETYNNSITIEPNLKEGLYYWKLFNEDFDFLFCGKIIIK